MRSVRATETDIAGTIPSTMCNSKHKWYLSKHYLKQQNQGASFCIISMVNFTTVLDTQLHWHFQLLPNSTSYFYRDKCKLRNFNFERIKLVSKSFLYCCDASLKGYLHVKL